MTVTRGRPPSHGDGYLAGLFDGPVLLPFLPDAACANHAAGLPAEVWDSDASSADRDLAAAACRACPALTACYDWVISLPRHLQPSGTVAGHWRRDHRQDRRDEAVTLAP